MMSVTKFLCFSKCITFSSNPENKFYTLIFKFAVFFVILCLKYLWANALIFHIENQKFSIIGRISSKCSRRKACAICTYLLRYSFFWYYDVEGNKI
jgi:hypothetical protein